MSSEPHYITAADLEAFEGRLINRLAELELRIERRFNEQVRWTISLILPIYALILGMLLTLLVLGLNVASRLP